MSYLDLPRIQFGGLFYTNPSTTNNYWPSYNQQVQLTDSTGQYLSNAQQGGPSGWNAAGVAQLWLSECSVLSAVGPAGTAVSGDPVVGAAVQTPSPQTPQTTPDGKGYYDIAKLVDLDPLQQTRSRGYGLRIFLKLPNGEGGFSGKLSVPELRYMGQRVNVPWGSWAYVGNWMGMLSEVRWFGDISGSAFLQQFQKASKDGIAFKIAMDLHQNSDATRMLTGDMFCYGRILGIMGPALPGELAQVVPGRILSTPPKQRAQPRTLTAEAATEGTSALEAELRTRLGNTIGKSIDELAKLAGTGDEDTAGASLRNTPAAAEAAAAPAPWNTVFALVRQVGSNSLLHLDLSFAILLNHGWKKVQNGAAFPATELPTSDGTFVVDSGIQVGVLTSSGVQPLSNGAVSFANQYQQLNSPNKTCKLIKNSGMVDVPLTDAEAKLLVNSPLVITVNGTPVLQEPDSGYFMDLSLDSLRLYSGQDTTIQVMARKFGQPLPVGSKPVTWVVLDQNNVPITDNQITLAYASPTDANGLATLKVTATSSQDIVIPLSRGPLDSLVFFAYLLGPDHQPIADGNSNYNLSVLFWPPFQAPATPTWAQDVGPILKAYARLYPGMKDRLDIGNETTVKGFARAMYEHMAAPFDDPAYMPVTRDLAPPKVQMILDWLKPYLPPQS